MGDFLMTAAIYCSENSYKADGYYLALGISKFDMGVSFKLFEVWKVSMFVVASSYEEEYWFAVIRNLGEAILNSLSLL